MEILTFMGEVFLDTLIDHFSNKKVMTYIGITTWHSDRETALKMLACSLLFLLAFFAYAYQIKEKRNDFKTNIKK